VKLKTKCQITQSIVGASELTITRETCFQKGAFTHRLASCLISTSRLQSKRSSQSRTSQTVLLLLSHGGWLWEKRINLELTVSSRPIPQRPLLIRSDRLCERTIVADAGGYGGCACSAELNNGKNILLTHTNTHTYKSPE
jgi:hypothetical protein